MKRLFEFALVASLAVVSCQKNGTPVNETPAGVPMKLVVSLAEETKVSYAPDGNVLKTTWDASETISVITLESSNLVSVDNFTSTGAAGRSKAEFTGTFTGGAAPTRVIVIYPALTDDGTGNYYTAPYTDYTGGTYSYLGQAKVGDPYFSCSANHELKQTADNDASHLRNYCIMTGAVDIDDIKANVLTTTLRNEMTVLKLTVTFPASLKGKKLEKMNIAAYDSADASASFARTASWEYVDLAGDGIYARGGGSHSYSDLYADITIPDSGVVTLYFANPLYADRVAGDKLLFTATVDGAEYGPVTKTFTSAVSFEKGFIYRLSVTIP